MYHLILLFTLFLIFLSMVPLDSHSHRSGCHRWHSCPSHTGSYECGDLGHDDYCSNNDDSDEENDNDNDNDNDKERENDNEN